MLFSANRIRLGRAQQSNLLFFRLPKSYSHMPFISVVNQSLFNTEILSRTTESARQFLYRSRSSRSPLRIIELFRLPQGSSLVIHPVSIPSQLSQVRIGTYPEWILLLLPHLVLLRQHE
jgi:hypothetical protein